MAVTTMHRDGHQESNPPRDSLALLRAELDGPEDPEHPDVAVSHETGWTVSAFSSGRVVFENVDDDKVAPRQMTGVSREQMLTIFERLVDGDVAFVAGRDRLR